MSKLKAHIEFDGISMGDFAVGSEYSCFTCRLGGLVLNLAAMDGSKRMGNTGFEVLRKLLFGAERGSKLVEENTQKS